MNLLERVRQFIARHELLRAEQRLIVAVSGGADSLCLLHVLHRLGDYDLYVAHLDHDLRPGSEGDAAFVRETAADLGLPATVERGGVQALIDAGRGQEEAGRIARYRFLARVAVEQGAAAVVTGHTAGDQAETILMNLLRGSGPHGLAGMRPSRELSAWDFVDVVETVRLVRPLLEISRSETHAYCERQGLKPRIDPTNLERDHLRNRIRLDLIPELQQYQPALEQVLGRTGRVMRATADLLEDLVERATARCARTAGPGARAIKRQAFAELPQIVRWELLRRLLGDLLGDEADIDFETVEAASRAALAGPEGRRSLLADLELEAAGPEAVLRRRGARVRFPDVPQIERERSLPVPGRAPLAGGWELRLKVRAIEPGEGEDIRRGKGPWSEPRREAADLATLGDDLTLRSPRDGDRVRPLGMDGSMSLADFFINQGIPRLQRRWWPLVTADESGIVWVIGLRLAEPFRVTPETKDIVEFVVMPPESE